MVIVVWSTVSSLRDRPLYLWVIFAIPALATFGHAIAPGQPVFKGQDLGIIADIGATVLAVALWVPYRRTGRWSNSVFVFLAVVFVAWLYEIIRIQWDQSLFNDTVVTVPVAMALIALKPVGKRDLVIALLVLAYSLIAISGASLVFGGLGWMPNGFQVSDAGGGRIPLLDLFGVPNRWGGPFESVNYASPIGGLLIVIGASRRGWNRWIILVGGIVVLALGQARTSIFATVAALLVLVMWSPVVSRLPRPSTIRWFIAGVAALAGTLYVMVVDPTLNGRTPIWSDFLALWHQNSVFGIGDSGVRAYMESRVGTGLVTHSHAHSVLLDALVRYGLVLALLTLVIFGIAVYASIRALKSGDPSPLSITVFVILAGSAETIHSWHYWTAYMASLVWVVLSGVGTVPRPADSAAQST
jgi:O-Antigen ligase